MFPLPAGQRTQAAGGQGVRRGEEGGGEEGLGLYYLAWVDKGMTRRGWGCFLFWNVEGGEDVLRQYFLAYDVSGEGEEGLGMCFLPLGVEGRAEEVLALSSLRGVMKGELKRGWGYLVYLGC